MHPRIDHDADGAIQRSLQIADPAQRLVGIEPEFVGDLFGIEPPALAIGRDAQRPVEQRQFGPLQHRTLEDMARDTLMINEGRDGEARPVGGVAQVDVESRRA